MLSGMFSGLISVSRVAPETKLQSHHVGELYMGFDRLVIYHHESFWMNAVRILVRVTLDNFAKRNLSMRSNFGHHRQQCGDARRVHRLFVIGIVWMEFD